ncbi:phosphatidylinositol kinase, partial [Gaertneriomyces semiglobifer]
RKFLISLQELHTDVLLNSLRQLLYFDDSVTYQVWVAAFPVCWGLLTSRERHDAHKTLVPLLAREYHAEQAAMRPNVIQALLEGICRCEATIQPRLPPQLVKYLGKTHNAWYIAIELLQQSIADTRFAGVLAVKEDEKIRESTLDALCELFWNLSEDDYFFGVWRRRSLFAETNAAVSFEQCSMWPQAQKLYEAAQAKARTGVLPFTESEYRLWEDHWVISAQKLQQWEMLMDLARHESNTDLVLECAWRLSDWMQEKDQLQAAVDSLQDSNPRRNVYQAFMLLLQFPESPERQKEFIVKCDEGTQNALRRWSQLPKEATEAHIPLLHQFQQYVELNEAAQIHQILATTTVPNISDKQQELKGILTTWRDRMPNEWDDITLWSDIIHWRQHVFQIINKAYLPLIPQLNVQQNGSNVRDNPSSYAFRGYHETAWTINRFAHVARKHQLIDVCNDALSKIYTLPNIEIHEAFYKLREQAKSYFVNPSDYATGLDVINNTNLLYFNTIQKAEFFALKGIFFSKLNLHNDAEKAFSSSIQLDTNLAKGWAAYAQYHDRMFKERPTEMRHGVSAVNFYLQAAAQYANARSRKFLARVLWLLSLDDNERQIGAAFDDNKSDVPTWYWITFIPQLISALSGKEAAQAKEVLKKIAKQFPQALYFQLRTARDEHLVSKKQALAAGAPRGQAPVPGQPNGAGPQATPARTSSGAETGQTQQPPGSNTPAAAQSGPATPQQGQGRKLEPLDHLEEVHAVVKTAFPLLSLSMETMLDQIMQRLKPTQDEDIYRLIVALLNDGVQMYLQQLQREAKDVNAGLSPATEVNLLRFAESMSPNHIKYKAAFEQDFIKSKPNLSMLVERFRDWRDKLEIILDSRPKRQHLEHFSHWLVEFENQKFEDIEVPGQYFLIRDNNKDFVRIDRFEPDIDLIRGYLACHRRFTIRGHDGTLHPFSVQHPAARHCRREERIIQLFRILNSVLEKKKESRQRSLTFNLPVIVPLAPTVRLVEDDPSYVTLQDVWEDYCSRNGQHKDDATMFYINRMRDLYVTDEYQKSLVSEKDRKPIELLNYKTTVFEEVAARFMPDTILTNFMTRSLASYGDLWSMRKHFTHSLATVSLMAHLLSIGQRTPHKFNISRKTGKIWTSELLPSLATQTYLFSNGEPIPFRFTPNIQTFLTPVGVDGVFAASLQGVARALTEPDYELEDYLSIFIRDELVQWQGIQRKPPLQDQQLREFVGQNVDLVLRRTHGLACRSELDGVANRTILDLIATASNPHKLAQMDISYQPRL